MAFEKHITLKDCQFSYQLADTVKKYTLLDTTFFQNKVGNYELNYFLEEIPNSKQGFQLRIIINKELSGFKLTITDKSGLRVVNIFKDPENKIIQDKFYFLMNSLVERGIFTKKEN